MAARYDVEGHRAADAMEAQKPRAPRNALARCEIERDSYHREWTRATKRIRDALLQYRIAEGAEGADAVVSWRYVAECMAKTLGKEASE